MADQKGDKMNKEAMKNQTFGVEVEMNSITRENAAKLAAEFFGTGRWADSHLENGYCAWSAWDAEGREWKFEKDSSINGPEAEKCEMVTPILHYNDMETLQELCRRLRKAGAKSDPSRGCGIHIHVGADGHTPQTLRNLVNIMASKEKLFVEALNIDAGRISSYCQPVDKDFLYEVNAKKPKTMEELADVWYKSQLCDYMREGHYNRSRYHMLNLHATFTKGTIEFRLFQFENPDGEKKNGIHAGRLKAFVQLALALSQIAKEGKNFKPDAVETEDKKYFMRYWLYRIGFLGDEFATAREVLTHNLKDASRANREAA